MFTEIQAGHQYAWGERVVEIDGAVTPTTVSARDIITGEFHTLPISKLAPLEKPTLARDIRNISDEDWKAAKERLRLLKPLVALGRVDADQLKEVAGKLKISPRQVQRLIKALRQSPLASTAAGKKPGRRVGTKLTTTEVDQVVTHCIHKHYLRPERASIQFTWERVDAMCHRLGLPAPSRMTVSRRIDALSRYDTALARHGRKAARRQEGQVGSLVTSEPLEVIQIDHTRVDVIVVTDDKYRLPLGRPCLTLAIDVHTRCILGFYLSMDGPSSISTALCIAHAILPKEEWLKSLEIDVPWPMYGRPTKIHTDNGADFLSSAVARGCEELGIILEHRPVGLPEWGGHIERLIGTMMGRVHFLPGTTFSNPKAKGDEYDSEGKACLTLNELREWLVREITTRYHATPHRGIGTSPAKAWDDGLASDRSAQGGV